MAKLLGDDDWWTHFVVDLGDLTRKNHANHALKLQATVLVAEERRAEVSALTELAKNANWPVELRAMVELATERYETARQLKRRLRALDDTTKTELAMANKLVSVGRWMRVKDQVGQFKATTGWLQRKKSVEM